MQNKSMHCRMLADSMHTLRRANQCLSNPAPGPWGPPGGGGTLYDAPPLRPGRRSGGPGRRSGGPGRRSDGQGRVAASAYLALLGDGSSRERRREGHTYLSNKHICQIRIGQVICLTLERRHHARPSRVYHIGAGARDNMRIHPESPGRVYHIGADAP
jgi:hypothetical protein